MDIKRTTTWTIPDDRMDKIATDLITTAVEGGINYWALVHVYKWDCPVGDRMVIVSDVEEDPDDPETEKFQVTVFGMKQAIAELFEEGKVKPFYNSGSYSETFTVRLAKLFDAITNGDKNAEDDYDFDASDADAMFQIAALGEIVYG